MTDNIQKFLNTLDKETREYIKKRISELKKEPFVETNDIKKLKGWGNNVYRLRIGKMRVIFQRSKNKTTILAINYRGNIY